METIMSKNNDTSKLNHAALEDHGILADSELAAVTGGTNAQGSWFVALATALGKAANAQSSR
jgi:hypothetical protein